MKGNEVKDMKINLYDYVSDCGKNVVYGLPTTEELAGRTAKLPCGCELSFDKELAVKVDDDLFLAEKDGKLYLIEEAADESLKAIDAVETAGAAAAFPEDFEGWETDLCLASGYVLTATFAGGKVTLKPSPEPVVNNPFGGAGTAAPKAPEGPVADPVDFPVKIAETGAKRFILYFPETGETLFFNARRFLLYGLLRGRVVTGFVEIPAR